MIGIKREKKLIKKALTNTCKKFIPAGNEIPNHILDIPPSMKRVCRQERYVFKDEKCKKAKNYKEF